MYGARPRLYGQCEQAPPVYGQRAVGYGGHPGGEVIEFGMGQMREVPTLVHAAVEQEAVHRMTRYGVQLGDLSSAGQDIYEQMQG